MITKILFRIGFRESGAFAFKKLHLLLIKCKQLPFQIQQQLDILIAGFKLP